MELFRRIDLSNRPLFLLCGSKGSGKTTLLTESGLACEYLYPNANALSRRDTPVWFFSQNALYVSGIGGTKDMVSPREDNKQTETGGKKRRQKKNEAKKQTAPISRLEAFYAELKKKRLWRRRAIDGALFVVPVNDIIKSGEAQIKKIAAELRDQANAIVTTTGYRIPIYFAFNKSDEIEGFRLYGTSDCTDSRLYGTSDCTDS